MRLPSPHCANSKSLRVLKLHSKMSNVSPSQIHRIPITDTVVVSIVVAGEYIGDGGVVGACGSIGRIDGAAGAIYGG